MSTRHDFNRGECEIFAKVWRRREREHQRFLDMSTPDSVAEKMQMRCRDEARRQAEEWESKIKTAALD